MSKLFMHGSGMLKRIPISFGDWKWDTSQSWISLLELGSRQPVFEERNQEDYLVLELSYLVESKIVQKPEGEIYTRNQKNISQGQVQEGEAYFSMLEEKPEAWEEAFERYIQWIAACFEPEHIILVRTVCPDRCMSGAFLHRYSPENKEAFQERCKYFEEYFIRRTNCIVVDIARDFLADGNDMKYGLYVSYERLFYRNMGRIMKKILSGKSRERCYCQSEYKLALQRIRAFYPAAYRRGEEELLMERSCAVNCLVRALNPTLIEKYEETLIALEGLKCRDYKDLLARGNFQGHEELKSLVLVLQELEEGKYSETSLEILEPFWGKETGIERQIQRIVWEYYEEQGCIGRHLISLKACRVLYTAMVYALAGNYLSACESVEGLLPARKKGLFRKKLQSRQDYWRLVSEYGQRVEAVGVDIWGNRMTKQIFAAGSSDYVSHEIAVDMFDDDAVAGKIEMLWSNSASRLVFDIYWVTDTVGRAELSEDEIKQRLDGFMEFILAQYGRDNILLHQIRVRWECSTKTGEREELPGAALLQKKALLLEEYQHYLLEKYQIACLSLGDRFSLCDKSEVAVFGINYQREYFEAAYGAWEIWKSEHSAVRREWGIHQNFVMAYPMLNLGDDLFLHMLLQRYPEQTFTLYVKNQRLKDCYSRYKNLEVYVCDSPLALKKCRNHILIGGSMFIENVGWGVKYENQCHVVSCAKNNYLLGANFGPYSNKEYLEFHQRLFEHYRDICFRENYSWKRFAGNKVRVAPDIVFGYGTAGEQSVANRVIISVIQLKGRQELLEYKESYDSQMAALCREFLQAGTEVVLMSFCRGEGDEQAVRDICARLEPQEREQIYRYFYLGENFDETMKLLAESRWIIGTRFHAVVLGLTMEKTVYPVIYSDKTEHMLEDLGFSGRYCRISEMASLNRNAVLENEKYPVSQEKIRKDANKQFLALDKLFGKGDRR